MRWREMRVPRDPACPVCAGGPYERERGPHGAPLVAILVLATMSALAASAPRRSAPREWKAIKARDRRPADRAQEGRRRPGVQHAAPGLQAQFGDADHVHADGARRLPAAARRALSRVSRRRRRRRPGRSSRCASCCRTTPVLVALYQMQKDDAGRWRIAGCLLAPSTVKSA